MPDDLDSFILTQSPTAERPLLGLTVLVVEDSRFACEAMRLLCLRSGARIRRADCLKSARRHLSVYRPAVVIVDLGLPDGSGSELITELSGAVPRVGVILGVSGDAGAAELAMQAGADGFLEKPIVSLLSFQKAVLSQLPAEVRPRGMRMVHDDQISPDPLALRDDLAHISDILNSAPEDGHVLAYAAQFLGGLARIADDDGLASAAASLDDHRRNGQPTNKDIAFITGLVTERLQEQKVV